MSDALKLLRKELGNGILSPSAIAMCKVIGHLFTLHRQHVTDLQASVARAEAKVKALETRVFKLEHAGEQ